jgi:hypothetical protein
VRGSLASRAVPYVLRLVRTYAPKLPARGAAAASVHGTAATRHARKKQHGLGVSLGAVHFHLEVVHGRVHNLGPEAKPTPVSLGLPPRMHGAQVCTRRIHERDYVATGT